MADGIIEPNSLSRIERGRQVPSSENLEAIFQRIGVGSENYFTYFLGQMEFDLYVMKESLTNATIKRETEEADEIISRMEAIPEFSNGLNLQFLLFEKAANALGKKESEVQTYLLSNVEIKIVDAIAMTYFNENSTEKASSLLYSLLDCIDSMNVNAMEKAKLYPLITYNLSKYLGLAGKYAEAIKVCDMGIEVSLTSNRYNLLPLIIFNKACCLFDEGDIETCKRLVHQAYWMCDVARKFKEAEQIKKHAKEKFGMDIV